MQLHDIVANDDRRKPSWRLFSPTGHAIYRITTTSIAGASIDKVTEDGVVEQWHHDDFPDHESSTSQGHEHVYDVADGDWLREHCRPVLCPWDFNPYDSEEKPIEAWPEEVVDACTKAETVAWALHQFHTLTNALPLRYKDTTMTAALDTLVKGRLEDELKQHVATIEAFRKGRTEITVLPALEDDDVADT